MAQSGGGEIEVPNGVYIQDTDGVLWEYGTWDGSATKNGVAVVTDECRFVIELKQGARIPIDYGGYSSSLSLPAYSSTDEVFNDYSGASNTSALISAYGNGTDEAAGYCANFTFPNGKKGYLGSAGEWRAAYDNKLAIDTCISKAGGADLGSNYYWSSTRVSDYNGYNRFSALRWSTGSWTFNYSYHNGYYVCPFTELGDVTGIVEA